MQEHKPPACDKSHKPPACVPAKLQFFEQGLDGGAELLVLAGDYHGGVVGHLDVGLELTVFKEAPSAVR